MRFTDKGIQALKKGKSRYEKVEDGGSGLAIRISTKGMKTFSYLYRFAGKPRRMTLGVYRDRVLDASSQAAAHDARGLPYLTLADARIKLAEAKKKRDAGIDPGAEAVKGHRVERKAQTVSELITGYVERYAKLHKRPSSAAEDARMLNKDVRSAWGGRKASSITRADVLELLDEVVARGSPIAANRLLAVVRKMFRWAVRQGIISTSPAFEIDRPGGREASRDRVLIPTEIAEVWQAAGDLKPPYPQLVRLLLATGQRRGEVAGMRRRELDLEAKLWTIPRTRTKNGLDHEVPLSPLAMEMLRPSIPADDNRQFMFTSGRRGDRPIQEFKGAKRRLDALILKARKEAAEIAGEDPVQVVPMPHWTLHDLRRTVRTGFSRLRLEPEISERVLNHVPAGVRRTYDVHAYRDEKREVLDAWATHLQQLIDTAAAGDKVVRLRTGTE